MKGGANVLSRRLKILMYLSRACLTLPLSINCVAVCNIAFVSCKRNQGKCFYVFVIKLYYKHFLYCLKKICYSIYKFLDTYVNHVQIQGKKYSINGSEVDYNIENSVGNSGPHIY